MPVGQTAVDTGAQVEGGEVGFFGARTPGFPAGSVVGDDEGVFVEHGALKARIGAHVFADLFAHVAGKAVGGKAVEEDPEGFPVAQGTADDFEDEVMDGGEVAHEGEAGPQGYGHPEGLFGGFAPEFVHIPGAGVAAHAGGAVTFGLAFQPQKDFGIDRLRAGIAAE